MSSLGGNSNGKTYISGDGVGDIDDDGDELLEYVGFGEADDVCEDDLETLGLDVIEYKLVEEGVTEGKLVEEGVKEFKLVEEDVKECKLVGEGNLEKVTLDVWERELKEDGVVEGILEILEHGDGDLELVKDCEFDIVLNELEDGAWL